MELRSPSLSWYRSINLDTFIDPSFGSFDGADFCVLLTVELLKPILDWTQLRASSSDQETTTDQVHLSVYR
jgi:hypothetical protein